MEPASPIVLHSSSSGPAVLTTTTSSTYARSPCSAASSSAALLSPSTFIPPRHTAATALRAAARAHAPAVKMTVARGAGRPALETAAVSYLGNSEAVSITAPSGKRQMSWTADEATSPAAPSLPLSQLLEPFTYIDPNTPKCPEKAESGTKRRRIDLVDPSTKSTVPKKKAKAAQESEIQPPKPAKRAKSPKKKAQTITALATAPYQPAKDPAPEPATVSECFNAGAATEESAQAEPATAIPKPKKTRKPRAKPIDPVDPKTSKTAKRKKVKVKFNEADPPKLFSPERACRQIGQQDFLFGTSSQLAVEGSPTSIRETQLGMLESERVPNSALALYRSPQRGSYSKVPTAPHRTSLSVGQAEKEMWYSAARDFNGGIMRDDSGLSKRKMARTTAPRADTWIAEPAAQLPSICKHNYVLQGQEMKKRDKDQGEQSVDTAHFTVPPPKKANDDDWMLILSSSPALPVAILRAQQTDAPPEVTSPAISLPFRSSQHRHYPSSSPLQAQGIRSATSPTRKALDVLDFNINMKSDGAPLKSPDLVQAKPLTIETMITAGSPAKKSVGRPRKTAASAADAGSPVKKKPVGRPRKTAEPSSLATGSPPVKRTRGRPPKSVTTIASAPSAQPPSKRREPATKVLAPASLPMPQPDSWANIDDISDDDIPNTSSPPRRRATSTPPAIPPLQFSPTGSPKAKAIKTKASRATSKSSTKLKAADTRWPEVYTSLFPKITAAVRSQPRGTDQMKLSWHQKILLFDPIVLEDLTAWLNDDQHITITVKKALKKEAASKRRKRDDAAQEALAQPEFEMMNEPLQGWMVQKWCEEKSICCLWREGLRGGVKARY